MLLPESLKQLSDKFRSAGYQMPSCGDQLRGSREVPWYSEARGKFQMLEGEPRVLRCLG
jgi:hypothetical protein